MDFLSSIIDLFIHLDTHLNTIIEMYGTWTYIILFVIVVCETGLVVTPFLPGDSLLFAAGTFAARGSLSVVGLLILFSVASIIGDTMNYFIGRFLGRKLFHADRSHRFLKKEYLERTKKFYEVHGAKTIVIARFLPIVRTFAPFVAGVSTMHWGTFMFYNVLGGILWSGLFTLAGYGFGNIPVIRDNFEFVILAIIGVSILPGVVQYVRAKMKRATRD